MHASAVILQIHLLLTTFGGQLLNVCVCQIFNFQIISKQKNSQVLSMKKLLETSVTQMQQKRWVPVEVYHSAKTGVCLNLSLLTLRIRKREHNVRSYQSKIQSKRRCEACTTWYRRCKDRRAYRFDFPKSNSVEHDSYWGDGGDGSGKNRLGVLLQKLREELKSL